MVRFKEIGDLYSPPLLLVSPSGVPLVMSQVSDLLEVTFCSS